MIISGSHSFSVALTNTATVEQVTLQIDGSIWDVQPGSAATSWTFTVDTTKLTGTVASPVTHTFTAVFWDAYGQSYSASTTAQVAN